MPRGASTGNSRALSHRRRRQHGTFVGEPAQVIANRDRFIQRAPSAFVRAAAPIVQPFAGLLVCPAGNCKACRRGCALVERHHEARSRGTMQGPRTMRGGGRGGCACGNQKAQGQKTSHRRLLAWPQGERSRPHRLGGPGAAAGDRSSTGGILGGRMRLPAVTM